MKPTCQQWWNAMPLERRQSILAPKSLVQYAFLKYQEQHQLVKDIIWEQYLKDAD